MKANLTKVIVIFYAAGSTALAAPALVLAEEEAPPGSPDWLIVPVTTPASLNMRDDGKELVLANGLISRTFRITPNLASISFKNLGHGAEYLRAVTPEAAVTISGRRWEIGGMKGQPDRSYLAPAWLPKMSGNSNTFQYAGHRLGQPEARYPWQPRFGAPPAPWPPKGLRLTLNFQAPASAANPTN